jgi:hypothetical protein
MGLYNRADSGRVFSQCTEKKNDDIFFKAYVRASLEIYHFHLTLLVNNIICQESREKNCVRRCYERRARRT